jgi:hypothetical protein
METRTASGILIESHRPTTAAAPVLLAEQGFQIELLQERLADLELALEDTGWQQLGDSGREFSRSALRNINMLARIMWLKNPLIRRGVEVQVYYVLGKGVSIKAADPEVDVIIQEFLDDAKNQAELTGHQALQNKVREIQVEANLFFVFFSGQGKTRVRTIPMAEIDEILCNPEDAKDPWYYKRTWQQQGLDGGIEQKEALYPDWRHRPREKPDKVRDIPVMWDTPVYHVKVNALSDMRFGVSEVYAAIDWAKAYKEFLEDWATLTRALSRYAHKLSLAGGKGAVAAAKARLGSTLGVGSYETNPAPVVGSTFVQGQGTNLETMRIGGANVAAEDGRRLLLMVAAGQGLPETFYGDTSVGSLATAKSLDRPTELMMVDRQTLFATILRDIFAYVIEQAVRAKRLSGQVIDEDDGTPRIVLADDPNTGKPRKTDVQIAFPPILEHDVQASVGAIIDAVTLRGQAPAGTVPDIQVVTRMLLTALDVDDVEGMIETLFPKDGPDGEGLPEAAEAPAAERAMVEAVRELREAIAQLAGQNGG